MQTDAGWEEYYDYIFPDEEDNQPHFKLLQMAKMWKQTKDVSSDSNSSDEDEENLVPRVTAPKKTSDSDSGSSDSEKSEEENNTNLPLPLNLKDIDKDEEFSDESSSDEEGD